MIHFSLIRIHDPRSALKKCIRIKVRIVVSRANRFFVVDILPLGFGSGVTDPDESNIFIIV